MYKHLRWFMIALYDMYTSMSIVFSKQTKQNNCSIYVILTFAFPGKGGFSMELINATLENWEEQHWAMDWYKDDPPKMKAKFAIENALNEDLPMYT